jgi:hypothetical protein
MGTDVNAHPAGPYPSDLVPQVVHAILLTAADVEAGLTRFARIEGATGESLRWAGFHATLAIAAPVGEGITCFQRGVGQDGDPAHARPYLGGDQQTTRADPAQARQPRRQLVREEAQKILIFPLQSHQ